MSLPRHVLMTADAVGGVWTYALELAAMLSAQGVKVTLAVLGPAATPGQREAAAQARAVLHDTGLALDWTAESPKILRETTKALADLARRRRADLVQLHTPALVGAVAWPAPVLAVVHSCVGTWWAAVRGDAPVPEDFVWRMTAVKHGIEAAAEVIAPSSAMAEALRRIYQTGRRIRVVHNGRAALPAPLAGRDRNGVLTAGRLWDEGKNIATLDRAAGAMQAPVRAAGPVQGPNGAKICLSAIEPLGVLAAVPMVAAMTAARVFAAPALYEPFGLAVLEAAQAGLPLVLADIPTFRELWDGAALFLPARDGAAWSETLSALHADPGACRQWGLRAQSRAADYAPARFAAAMLNCYDAVNAAPRRASAA